MIPCVDGHAQERSLLDAVIEELKERDLLIADRNFCTTKFLFGIALRLGYFVIRRHATTLSWEKATSSGMIIAVVSAEPTLTLGV